MSLEFIESKNNWLIKEVKKLKERKFREKTGQFIVEGLRFTEEAIKSDFTIKYILLSEEIYNKEAYKRVVQSSNNKIYKICGDLFKTICSTETPQGILSVVENKQVSIKSVNGFYMLVDKVQDPGNLGTILRTAHAAGALGVILTKGTVDVYNEKTLRATMGAIFKIPIILDSDLSFTLNLKDKGFKVVSGSLDTEFNFYSLNLRTNVILVVGNEGNGISKEIYDITDTKVILPMSEDTESLNVSVAASIMMYEVFRQNTFEKI